MISTWIVSCQALLTDLSEIISVWICFVPILRATWAHKVPARLTTWGSPLAAMAAPARFIPIFNGPRMCNYCGQRIDPWSPIQCFVARWITIDGVDGRPLRVPVYYHYHDEIPANFVDPHDPAMKDCAQRLKSSIRAAKAGC